MSIHFEDWEAEQMADPSFRAAVRRSWLRYQLDRLICGLRSLLQDAMGPQQDWRDEDVAFWPKEE